MATPESEQRPEPLRHRPALEEPDPRPVQLPADPVPALLRENRARGADPDGWTLAPRRVPDHDLWPLHARALEALDQAHFGG